MAKETIFTTPVPVKFLNGPEYFENEPLRSVDFIIRSWFLSLRSLYHAERKEKSKIWRS